MDFRGAQILTGSEEGSFGWITVNYLLQTLVKVQLGDRAGEGEWGECPCLSYSQLALFAEEGRTELWGHWSPNQMSPVAVGCRFNSIHVINRILVSVSAWPCALMC